MEKFLEKKDLTILEMLNLFFKVKEKWTVSEIAKATNLSYKTVQKDMKNINDIFNSESSTKSGAYFETDGTAYTLILPDKFNYKAINEFFLKRSIAYLLVRDLLLNKKVTRNNFMTTYFISYPTFQKKKTIIKDILHDFDLTLDDKTVFKIVGEEKQIRLFTLYFFTEYYNYCGNCTPLKTVFELNPVIDWIKETVSSETNFITNLLEQTKYSILLGANMLRVRNGNLIEDSKEFEQYAKAFLLYDFVLEQMMDYLKDSNLTEEQIQRETIFLIALIRTQPSIEKNIVYNRKKMQTHIKNQPLVLKLTEVFIAEFADYIDMSLEQVVEFLMNNIINVNYQAVHFITDLRYFRPSLEYRTYKEEKIYQILIQKSEELFAKMRILLDNDEQKIFDENHNFLICKYYEILCGVIQSNVLLLPVNIKIIATNGEFSEKDIASKIKMNLSDFNIQVCDKADQPIDIVVTDIMDESVLSVFSGEFFSYSLPFTTHDYERLRKKVLLMEEHKNQENLQSMS